MAAQLPSEELGTAVGVLIWSLLCLSCSGLLMWLTWVHHERMSCTFLYTNLTEFYCGEPGLFNNMETDRYRAFRLFHRPRNLRFDRPAATHNHSMAGYQNRTIPPQSCSHSRARASSDRRIHRTRPGSFLHSYVAPIANTGYSCSI